MGHPNRLTCLLSASFAVLTANGVAHAQQSPAPAAAEAPRTEVEESDEIIVLSQGSSRYWNYWQTGVR